MEGVCRVFEVFGMHLESSVLFFMNDRARIKLAFFFYLKLFLQIVIVHYPGCNISGTQKLYGALQQQ